MAFDAGSIEATLTLNRNPFTAGLKVAKAQATEWAKRNKVELPITAKLDRASLATVKEQINKAVGKINVKTSLDRESLKAVQAQINRAVGRIQVRVSLDRESLARVREQIARTVGRIQAKVTLDRESLAALRARLAGLNARVTVRPVIDRDALLLLRARLEAMSFRVNIRANVDREFIQSFSSVNRSLAEGSENLSHFQRVLVAVVALLPVMASGFTAAVGAVGALASAFLIAGLGAGALTLVAVPAFKQIKAAVIEGQGAIDKLPPGLREAGNAMKELFGEYDKLVKANQKLVGIGISAWLNAGTAALKTLNPLIKAAANAFGDAGLMAIGFFEGRWWAGFVNFLSSSMGPAVTSLFEILFAFIRIIGNLTRAFWELGGSKILDMIVDGLQKFAVWTDKIGQNKTFQQFMDAAVRSLPVVGALLGNLIEFILKLAIGLEPLGTLIIRIFNGILEVLNNMPIPVLQALAFGVAALMTALALGAGGPVALGIAAIAGLATIFASVYTQNEKLRTALNGFADDLRVRFLPIWDTIVRNFNEHIKPAWEDLIRLVNEKLIPSIQHFGEIFLQEVWPKIQPFVNNITEIVIPAIIRFLGAIANIVSFLIDVFGPTVARELGAAVTVFDGSFQMIAGLLDIFTGIFTGDWKIFTQGITELTKGFWTVIAGMFGVSFEDLKRMVQEWDRWIDDTWRAFWGGITAFFSGVWQTIKDIFNAAMALLKGDTDRAADLIGQAWRRVANFFREPINWVIRFVIGPPGGIAGAWNTVMGWIGQPQLGVSAPPQIPAFTRGGVFPGYAPRQDSMLAAVSPGEAVMVPEWTRAVGGADAVRRMNEQAISGNLFYEGNPRGYSLGGIITHFAYGGVAPNVAAAGDEITRVFGGMPGGIGGVGARANASDHPSGYALDFMVLGNRGLGNRIADYFFANWSRLTTKYIIWLQRIASSPGAWRGMADRGSPTANHMDHVHASFLGGPGGAGGAAPIPMVSWWSIIAGQVTNLLKGLFNGSIPGLGGPIGQAISSIPGALIDKVIDALKGKLEGLMTVAGSAINTTAQGFQQNPLSGMGTADRGAIIPPGPSTLFNATGRPEPLTNLDVYERMKPAGLSVEDVLTLINAHGGGGSGDTYNVMLPERASVRELADSLDFKRRVVSKGRYSR